MIKKIGITLLAIVVILFVVVAIGKNVIAKTAITKGVYSITGLTLQIDSMDVGIVKTLIGIKGLKLFNPPQFTEQIMIDLPEIHVDYDLQAFLDKKVHLEEIRLNLKEFTVIKDKNGVLNLDALKPVQTAEKKEEPKGKKTAGEKGVAPEIQIDVLQLKVGKVIYKDYSQGKTPSVKEYEVNIDKRYENITDPQEFCKIIVREALLKTAIAQLANFDVNKLKDKAVSNIKSQAASMIEEQKKGLLDMGKGTGDDAAKEVVEETKDKLKKMLPF
ncbi:MAG: AsmA family protein [PVC group bacterium]|nr:AsmA family protein [PVC group bacterium]